VEFQLNPPDLAGRPEALMPPAMRILTTIGDHGFRMVLTLFN
jgi:hypothetical protein